MVKAVYYLIGLCNGASLAIMGIQLHAFLASRKRGRHDN